MKNCSITFILTTFSCFFLLSFIQPGTQNPPLKISTFEEGLFDSDELLRITLTGNLNALLNDQSAVPKNVSFILSSTKEDNSELHIPVEIKTRGHFRRLSGNCTYPPLLIQFAKEGPQQTSIFKEQHKLKLVMPCKGEEYVVREWLAYKIYNLLTPKSFKARLVKVLVKDPKNKKNTAPFFGILLEEERQMAKRNQMVPVEKKLQPQKTETNSFLTMAVFEYLIGNTDWSTQYMQNIKFLAADSTATPIAVPYDFDLAGIVNAPYALPAEELKMSSVRQRRYRGYCVSDQKIFEPVLARYNQLKNEIYKLYTNCSYLDEKYRVATLKYLDEFYETINDTKKWQKEFAYPCDKNGTGNVVIKGLKED